MWSGLVGKDCTDGDRVGAFDCGGTGSAAEERPWTGLRVRPRGHPNDQNHIKQSQEAGRSSQTGLLQGRGERHGCWTRTERRIVDADAKVNLGRHSDQGGHRTIHLTGLNAEGGLPKGDG